MNTVQVTTRRITTISTRRQEQGIVLIGALRGVFGFGSLARSALVKWSVMWQEGQRIMPKKNKAYTKELEDVASWFEKSELGNVSTKNIAKIIRKWIPESALKPEYRKKSKKST